MPLPEFTEAEKLLWEELRTMRLMLEAQHGLVGALTARLEVLQARTAVLMQLTPYPDMLQKKHWALEEFCRQFALENAQEWKRIQDEVFARFDVPPPWVGDSTPRGPGQPTPEATDGA